MSSTTTSIVRIDRSGLRHRTDLLGWRLSARINRARFVDAICSAVCSTNTGQLHERLCAPHRPRRVVRFARSIHRRVRVLGGPSIRAARGTDLCRPRCCPAWSGMTKQPA